MRNAAAKAKTRFKDKFQEFTADNNRRKLYERESLAFDAAEMISHLMKEQRVTKADLARMIGKSRAYVTQLLSGSRNMTMYTLADLGLALGYRFELKARSAKRQAECQGEKSHSLYRFCDRTSPYARAEDSEKNTAKHIHSTRLGA